MYGTRLFGGYNGYGRNIAITKIFSLPPHYEINLQVQFCKIDEWDGEFAYLLVDFKVAWTKSYTAINGIQQCGQEGNMNEVTENLNLNVQHSGPTAVVVFTTNLDQDASNESWGFRDFILSVQKCPEGCLICKVNDTILKCYVWKLISTSWISQDINGIQIDGWNVVSGIPEASMCGAAPIFGGFNKTGSGTIISKTVYDIPPHYKLTFQVLFIKIDSWDNEIAKILIDDNIIWQRNFYAFEGYAVKICGDSNPIYKTMFGRIEYEVQHNGNQAEIKFLNELNEPFWGESFGLRDFVLYYGSCTDNCAQCTGPSGSECQMCSKGSYNTGVSDKICQLCYRSCYQCNGPTNEDCTDCGDINIYYKQLIAGQCICTIQTIEYTQDDGTTLCLPCHPRCWKCYQPFDNTDNQYCTMCIAGQNRIVSDELKCVCRTGYGNDGISDYCFKCHYTCQDCKGPLVTDCTLCSPYSNRHLSVDNQCLCNKSYMDTGIDDVICLYICDYSCSDCDVPGEDKCTSCPSTRSPDRQETTFKCLCKDSHYFSDNYQLECLECHSTCLTCNGIYENNCLTCDLTYRQLVMFKCICPYGYYDVGDIQCSPCYYTCMTCYGPEEDQCITCAISNNREIKANKCVCLDKYMEKEVGDIMCYQCSYRCAECSGTIDNCISCPAFSFRDLGIDNKCSCPPKSFDQIDNPICIFCHNTCLTCNGKESNQCVSCNALSMRQLDSQGSCLCMSKYFDVGLSECQACSSLCLDCVNTAQNCISCKPDRYLQENTCVCQSKLFGATISTYQVQGKTKIECQNCHYSCLNCNGITSTKCISCLDSEMRIFNNNSCICIPRYFDNGNPNCQQCNYRCETCLGLATSCLSCNINNFRKLINQQCLCEIGYFDDGSNPICQKCHYSCSQCSVLFTRCEACSLMSNRQFNSILSTCACSNSYYDSGIEVCQKCHYSCLTCFAFGAQFCNSCQEMTTSLRVLNAGVCQCLNGYYDDGVNNNCKKCLIQCLTCQNTADYCTSCTTTTRHLDGNTCKCNVGYFENNLDNCYQCDNNCVNCQTNSKICTECDQTQLRVLDNTSRTCICKIGTTEINLVCQICDINCLTCLNSISYCTSCKTLKILVNNRCQCIDGTYELNNGCLLCNSSCSTCINSQNYCTSCSIDKYRVFKTGNICICQDGYYEQISTLSCQKCDLSCLTCKNSATYCLSCDTTYNLSLDVLNRCICTTGYYFNTFSKQCEACAIKCKECQTFSQCMECEDSTRYYEQDNMSCPCKDGYYESNLEKCAQCDLTCKTCINQSQHCLTCESVYYRIMNNSNQCLCQDGYYDIGIEMCFQCNSVCKTCKINSSKCFSCYELQHYRQLNLNQCICQKGFYDNGQLICEKCSNQCLTCLGKRDNCTSCDINKNRIDQSTIKRCPCLSGFYQDENENCSKCHFKCQTCSIQRDNCISCSISKTSNRQSISNNCICKDGYYDDDTQVDCQKCSNRCKQCQDQSYNCLSCFSNLRNTPPLCNCKYGFFENSTQNCEPCENQCETCEKSGSNCLTCKEGRHTQLCVCQEGYYEGGYTYCIQCEYQCKTCIDSPLNCLICKGDRINLPQCICPDGFYDDFMNETCQICDWLCKTCHLNGCLICNGNRILSPDMTCDQPPNSICHTHTPWCSTCEVAVIQARFSDDLLSIIIKFDFPLNPKYFYSQFEENICYQILDEITFNLLGSNPFCYLDPHYDTKLIINLGEQAKIVSGDLLNFYSNQFGHLNCENKINLFILKQVLNPINPVYPKLNYDLPTYILNPCDDNTIPLISKINDGLRNLIGIIWTYTFDGFNGNGNLEEFVQLQTRLQLLELSIPFQTLPKQSNITFYVEFQNFVSQKTIQIITIQTHSGKLPTIFWIQKPTYFTFETISLNFLIRKRDCSDGSTLIDNSNYEVSLFEVFRNDSNSRSSRVNYSEFTSQNVFNVVISKYTLSPRTAYTFSQTTSDTLMNYSITRNITLSINSAGIICLFNGTKKIQNYRKNNYIYISCKDLDTQYEWNEDQDITIQVQCIDLTMNSSCRDLNKKIIKVNQTESIQQIPKQTIKPYSIQSWQVIAKKQQYQYQFKQNIVYLDNDFQLLNVTYNEGYIMRPVNNYENLYFNLNIPFEERQYLLEYQIAMIYNFELIQILHSDYYQFQFRIFDYFQQFKKGKQIHLKFLAQFTNEIIPSQDDLKLKVNQPPSCIVSFIEQTIQALKPLNIIATCDFSYAAPFNYQLRYFIQNQDLSDFKNKISDYSLILNSYQTSNTFQGYFPYSEGTLIISAMDSYGSFLEIEKRLNITKTILNCSKIDIKKLSYTFQISLFFEILLNHQEQEQCSVLSKQLYNNIKKYLYSTDINDQLLVYQTTKLYKRLIFETKNNKSTKRFLKDNLDQGSCFINSTKQFYIQIPVYVNSVETPASLQAEFKQIKAINQDLIKKKNYLVDQITQQDLFLDEQLYQKKEAILNSLSLQLLMIDDIFIKISTVMIASDQDKQQIYNITEQLLSLIFQNANEIHYKAKVNGQQLTINGEIIKFQLSKITKDKFNSQFDIGNNYLDGLIDFVQKEQIDINFNHLYLSKNQLYQLQTYFILTNFEIDNSTYKQTKLYNQLYNNNRKIEYQGALHNYRIDMFNYTYCQELDQQYDIYQYECFNLAYTGQLLKCEFLIEEIDNQNIQVSCKCQYLGVVFLVKYSNNSINKQNNTSIIINENDSQNSELKLNEQPILLFHGIFITFSFFFYFELISIEIKQKQIFNRVDSDHSVDESIKKRKEKVLQIYPGNFAIYKQSFKFIHQITSLIYMKSEILKLSFRFLQQSLIISLFTPIAFIETVWLNKITIVATLIINCLFFLLVRMIFKICQAIYRFGGILSTILCILFLLIHAFCYFLYILQLKHHQVDFQKINLQVSVILVCSFFLFYVILDPIMIFLRIFILKFVYFEVRNLQFNPKFQLIYFFVEHDILVKIFEQYIII